MSRKYHHIVYFLFFFLLSFCAQAEKLDTDMTFSLIDKEGGAVLLMENWLDVPIHVRIHNKSDKAIEYEFIVSNNEKMEALYFEGKDKHTALREFKDTYNLKYYLGDPSQIKHDDSYLYRLPFKKGKWYKVSQSFNGKFSHNNDNSRYAVDFNLKEGEPVFAAREGKVVFVVDKYTENGGVELKFKANKIVIQHPDGTFASYVHLQPKGVLVKVGEVVTKGQHIGYSGNTGFSSGPHLHFVVRKETDLAVPIYFEGYENKVLAKGKKYKVKE